jgi:hypothetical protein
VTRDEWCAQFAQRMAERSDMAPQEAAAYAANMADSQREETASADPDEWEDPAELCDIEMSYWEG